MVFLDAPQGASALEKRNVARGKREDWEMAKLSLKFEDKVVKEVPVGNKPISIGRAPDNDLPVDNPAVSNYHARIYYEAGKLVIEDLDSLNGTFVNEMRVERATLHDNDSISIGKHHVKVDTFADAPVPVDTGRKQATPRINETMVLDTKVRREMLQQASALGERMQFAAGRMKMATLVVLGGRVDHKEYVLTNRLTVIGKSVMATVHLRGWFKPQVAAQINQRDDGYYLGPGTKTPSVNGLAISGPVRLNDGDLIEVCGVRLNFLIRE
jgi:pSer/pThr/pTyr-binding forkhead associated (FHA) protein